jgi:hypothetical protein
MFSALNLPPTLDHAAEFVRRHGTPLQHARLDWLLDGDVPQADALEQVARSQGRDGGFAACWSQPHASIEGTCHMLGQLETFASFDAVRPMRLRAAGYLIKNQRDDGAWDEVGAASPPAWLADPLEARLYLTALAGWALVGVNGRVVERAASVLARRVRPNGSLPGPIAVQWLAAGLFVTVGDDDLARAALDPVADEFDELDTAWLAWLAAVVPASHVADRARRRLAELQRRDGGWSTLLGAAHEASVTMAAVVALTASITPMARNAGQHRSASDRHERLGRVS